MYYHDPIHLCRQTFFDADRRRVIYRPNRSNYKYRWLKPVPTVIDPDEGPILIYDHGVAPLRLYLPTLLQASTEHPLNSPTADITHTPAPEHAEALARLRAPQPEQGPLRNLQDIAVQTLTHRLLKKVGDPHPADGDALLSVDDVLREVSHRIGIGIGAVLGILRRLEGFSYTPASTSTSARTHPANTNSGIAFSRSDSRFMEVQRTLNVLRVSKLPKSPFSIDALAEPNCPGGYPTHCPVLGVELEWGVNVGAQLGVSFFSPKIGRYDILQSYTGDNVLLMSAWARRFVEGFGSPTTLAPLLQTQPDLIPRIRAWNDRHPFPHCETLLRAATTAKTNTKTNPRKAPEPLKNDINHDKNRLT